MKSKLNKKKFILGLLSVFLVAGIIGGIIAYVVYKDTHKDINMDYTKTNITLTVLEGTDQTMEYSMYQYINDAGSLCIDLEDINGIYGAEYRTDGICVMTLPGEEATTYNYKPEDIRYVLDNEFVQELISTGELLPDTEYYCATTENEYYYYQLDNYGRIYTMIIIQDVQAEDSDDFYQKEYLYKITWED